MAMQHKDPTVNTKHPAVVRKEALGKEQQDERRKAVLEAARDACARMGGVASIDERYAVVDLEQYTVTAK